MSLAGLAGIDSIERAGWIALAVLATALHFYLEPLRWSRYYCHDASAQAKRRVRQTFLLSSLASYLLPFKLGVPLRLALLHRLGGIKLESLGAGMVIDAFVSLIVWTAGSLVASIILAYRVHLPAPGGFLLIVTAVIAIVGVMILWILRQRLARLRQRLADARIALRRHARHVPALLGVLAVDVSSYGVRHVCIVMAVLTSHTDVIRVGAAGILATFVGIVSGLPMGLVGYDATIATLLISLGLSASLVAVVIAINRLLNLAVALLLGIPAAIALGMGNNPFQIIGRLTKFKPGP